MTLRDEQVGKLKQSTVIHSFPSFQEQAEKAKQEEEEKAKKVSTQIQRFSNPFHGRM